MKYTRLLAALGVLCLLAAPVLSAQAGNEASNSADQGNNCNFNCNGNGPCAVAGCPQNCNENGCENGNACKLGQQDGTGNQNGNGQNGNQQRAQDGTGPKRDGCCGNCK
jgi:hypothetical protein